jgi:hypothetical protein
MSKKIGKILHDWQNCKNGKFTKNANVLIFGKWLKLLTQYFTGVHIKTIAKPNLVENLHNKFNE